MLFYDFRAAPSPRKVRLFIAEKGIDVPSVQVDLRAQQQHSPGFLARNSGGTVPVLELDDGNCLTESLAICHYLESRFPEPNLMGRDGHEQARVLMWNDILTLDPHSQNHATTTTPSTAKGLWVAERNIPDYLPATPGKLTENLLTPSATPSIDQPAGAQSAS